MCQTGLVFCQSSAWFPGTKWFRAGLCQGGHIPVVQAPALGGEAAANWEQGPRGHVVNARCACQFSFTGDFFCLESCFPLTQ